MTTVTFILGLSGSGKTWLADRIDAAAKFDEGFLNDQTQHDALIAVLRSGTDCVVVEIAYCREEARKQIVSEITKAVPNVKINWLCIENNLDRANKNCRQRTNKGDPEGHVKINLGVSPSYTYPDGGVILKMWTLDSYSPYVSLEAALEEYKSLRSEILESQKQRVALLQISLGFMGVLFGYFIQDKSLSSLEALPLCVLATTTSLFTYSTRVRERRIAHFIATYLRSVSHWSGLSAGGAELKFFQRSSTTMVLAMVVISAVFVVLSFPGWPRPGTELDMSWLIAVIVTLLNGWVLRSIDRLADFRPPFQKALSEFLDARH